jgi:two-component sensor histidine kinase
LEGIIRQIMTLAEVYEHLLGVGMNGQIDFAYMMALCGNLPDLQPPRTGSVALRCDAERVLVTLAPALGLVLTELISNSYERFSRPGW